MKQKLNLLHHHNNRISIKIKEWFSKWDKTIAAVTGVIVFCALLILVIVNIKIGDDDKPNNMSLKNLNDFMFLKDGIMDYKFPYRPYSVPSCVVTSEKLQCSGVKADELCEQIANTWNEDQKDINTLELKNIQYEENKIEDGWLNCETTFSFSALTIDAKLANIGAKAFSGSFFQSMTTLTLSNLNIGYFRKNMFEGTNLQTLQISSCPGYNNFEANVFEAISTTITILQITQCVNQLENENILANMTGSGEPLQGLITLDLSHNNLRVVKASSFKSASSLQALYLGDSQITEIQLGAFDLQFLKTLDLSQNMLMTLPDGIFQNDKGIILSHNQWRCDCDLVWLRDFSDSWPENFAEGNEFMCNTGGKDVYYKNVTFCTDNTTHQPLQSTGSSETTTKSTTTKSTTTKSTTKTTTTQTTEPTTETTTTPKPTPRPGPTTIPPPMPPKVAIKCILPSDSSLSTYEDAVELLVRNESVTIKFAPKPDTSSTYFVQILGDLPPFHDNILWFNAEQKEKRGCARNVTDGIEFEIENLEKNNTYIFCLINSDKTTVSPFDCGALSLPLDANIWLYKSDMIAVICGFCGTVILAAVITGVIVFYCIRQHPSFIKGNKRVIIVGNQTTDRSVVVMPPTYYEEIDYRPPSLNSRSNGYLTPKQGVYESPRNRNGSQLRTISANVAPSTSSGERIRRNHDKRRTRLAFEEHIYEPPPLPPDHPSDMIYNDTLKRSCSRV